MGQGVFSVCVKITQGDGETIKSGMEVGIEEQEGHETGEPTESMCPPVPPYSPFFSSFCAPSCHHGMLQHASASFPFDEGG